MTVQIVKQIEAADEMGYHVGFSIPYLLQFRTGVHIGLIARLIGVNQGVTPTLGELSFNIVESVNAGAGGTIYGIDLDSVRSWRMSSAELDRVKPNEDYGCPFTTASVAIPIGTSLGVLTADVTPILTEIFARSGYRAGYNIGFVIVGDSADSSNLRNIQSGSFSLAITLDSLPAATGYRIEGHLAGQAIVLVDDSVVVYNTLQSLKDLESQDIIVIPDGDADGVEVTFATSEAGTFSPASITFDGSEPAIIHYTPTSTPFKHFLSATNDGGLTDPDDVLFIVRRERLFPDEAIWYWPADEMELDTTGLHERFEPYSEAALQIFTSSVWNGHVQEQYVNYREGTATRIPFDLITFVSEADAVLPDGMLPFGENFIAEGMPRVDGSDSHGLLFDMDNGTLHEMGGFDTNGSGGFQGSHFQWDVASLDIRTLGYTSSAADGRPITPFVLTYDEILKAIQTGDAISHPLRFTIPLTALNTYMWDASHSTGNGGSDSPMYGTRMRLKADFDISGFSPVNQAILRTLKKYGMYLQDGGLSWFISSESDLRWDREDLLNIATIYPYTDFETVDQLRHIDVANSYRGIAYVPPPEPSVLSDFKYYIELTVNDLPASDIGDYFTVFKITGNTDIGGRISGSTPRFAAALTDGTTLLPHGVVRFVNSGGSADLVIRIRHNPYTQPTIRLYYDDVATDMGDKPAVLDTSTVAYLPLEEDPSGVSPPQMLDWSSNANNGSSAGTMTSGDSVAGQVGLGLDLDGSNDRIRFTDFRSHFTDKVTASILVNVTAAGDYPMLFSAYGNGGDGGSGFELRLNFTTGRPEFKVDETTGRPEATSASSIVSAGWKLVTGTYDGTTIRTYVNGTEVATAAGSGNIAFGTVNGWAIGDRYGGGQALTGKVDELAIANVAWSAAKIAFRATNELTNNITVGAEQDAHPASTRRGMNHRTLRPY